LIFGIFGACRREEITNLIRLDVQDKGEFIWTTLPNTKSKITREFAITDGNIQGIYDDWIYFENIWICVPVRPSTIDFFLPTGEVNVPRVNTIGGIPKKIATALGLSEPANYTGHCFRRSSASLLADAGADMHTLKRHGGWKSDNVAEGYVEASVQNKKIIATKIMGSSDTLRSTSNVMVEKPSINLGTASGVNIENVSNCVIYVNK
jgi:integrase